MLTDEGDLALDPAIGDAEGVDEGDENIPFAFATFLGSCIGLYPTPDLVPTLVAPISCSTSIA